MPAENLPEKLESLYLLATGLQPPDTARRSSEFVAHLSALLNGLKALRDEAHDLNAAYANATKRCDYLERLFEDAPDGHVVTDPDGTIRHVNRVGALLLNSTRDRLVGRPILDFIPDGGSHEFRSEMEHLPANFESNHATREWQGIVRAANGKTFDAAVTARILLRDDGQPVAFHWAVRDITARKKLEETMRQSELRLGAILRAMFNGLLLINDRGIVESFNPAAERKFRYASSEVVGQHVSRILPDLTATAADGELLFPENQETTGRRKEGEEFPVELSVSVLELNSRRYYAIIVRDITERRCHEEQIQRLNADLQRRLHEFETLLEVIPIGIGIAQDPHCEFIRFNPYFSRLMGVSPIAYGSVSAPDHERPKSFRLFHSGKEVSADGLPMRYAAAHGVVVRDQEIEVIHADGRIVNLLESAAPLFNPAGEVSGCVGAFLDITERKRAQERAFQAERLAAIGQMVAGLAHESRNALQRAQAAVDRIGLRTPNQPAISNLVDEIQHALDHLRRLFDEVRSYAAPVLLDRAATDLPDVWRKAWEDLANLRANRDAELSEDIAGQVEPWPVDAFRLEQVFRNILENALAACPDPVRIVIRCTQIEVGGQLATRVAVCDNGPGLSAEQRERIFEPFYTTKTRGTGLGMAIARRIVESHDGGIAVGEQACPGAEIVITLPWRPL
jgi:PAS domain S-box-containing protein